MPEEKRPLRGSQQSEIDTYKSKRRKANVFSALCLGLAAILLILTRLPWGSPNKLDESVPESVPGKRNVIFMVSDGMGPASVALARNFFQHTNQQEFTPLFLDKHLVGNSRTQSSNSFVTDSAAGATAFSCCLKTYNGAIGVDPEGMPCATILEAAKLKGFKTGMVVTTRVTDATPASFASHALQRSEEDLIAEQLVNWKNDSHPFGSVVDLLMGGGSCHFLPSDAQGSCRADDRHLISDAQQRGWSFIDSAQGLRDIDWGRNASLPLLALFAEGDLPFTIDYDDEDTSLPRLNETALTAVHALERATKDSDEGFFLLVEGSRIDHAGHSNDPGAQVREVLAYDEAFEAMVHYAKHEAKVPTIVVSTSDHETGGLSVSRQVGSEYPEYLWYPEVLARAQHSTEYLSRKLRAFTKTEDDHNDLYTFIREDILGPKGLGFSDITEEEVEYLAQHRGNSHDYLSRLQSVRAQIGWSSHGHSAVDVNVYAAASSPHHIHNLLGGNENTEVGHFMRKFLDISSEKLHSLTERLQQGLREKGWHSEIDWD